MLFFFTTVSKVKNLLHHNFIWSRFYICQAQYILKLRADISTPAYLIFSCDETLGEVDIKSRPTCVAWNSSKHNQHILPRSFISLKLHHLFVYVQIYQEQHEKIICNFMESYIMTEALEGRTTGQTLRIVSSKATRAFIVLKTTQSLQQSYS